MSLLIEKHSRHSNQRSQGFIYGFWGLDEASWTSQQHERWRGRELILCMKQLNIPYIVFRNTRLLSIARKESERCRSEELCVGCDRHMCSDENLKTSKKGGGHPASPRVGKKKKKKKDYGRFDVIGLYKRGLLFNFSFFTEERFERICQVAYHEDGHVSLANGHVSLANEGFQCWALRVGGRDVHGVEEADYPFEHLSLRLPGTPTKFLVG
ncbi:hypothetical protein NC653_006032 [Populus alba x Populus x berolinensis]|uniref:Uncharacterized protein n=1 Tax=Populus alba x Populus x berolinensis TaxID=444605 RepID=A0AAD6REC3_9ROSI|nr:hypothetical protein NC653_006032 [Populus alba x Populus x berolinensis]